MIIIYYTDNMIVFLSLINSKSAQEESIILNCNTTVAVCLTLCRRVLWGEPTVEDSTQKSKSRWEKAQTDFDTATLTEEILLGL